MIFMLFVIFAVAVVIKVIWKVAAWTFSGPKKPQQVVYVPLIVEHGSVKVAESDSFGASRSLIPQSTERSRSVWDQRI